MSLMLSRDVLHDLCFNPRFVLFAILRILLLVLMAWACCQCQRS